MMNCPRCLTPNQSNARFCWNCGHPLEPPRPLEGERKFVTVLFADVVSSTAMAEQLDPEQVLDIMNGAFAVLNAAVARYGGTIARLMGDAILAFFGAPVTHEDDAERAVRAGLEIQAMAAQYANDVRRRFGLEFAVRVGINSGLAVLAIVGSEIKTEYTAMGDTTNVAARLQSAAASGTVLISASTYRLVRPLFEVRPRGLLEVKGKTAPIESYEVVAPREHPGRVRGLDEVFSPLVGRDTELQLLSDRLAALQAGQGAFVSVIGEAGLGKSRLMAEARKQVDPAAVFWLEGRGLSYGQAISYYPWQQMLRHALGLREQDSPDASRDLLQMVAATDQLSTRDLPFLETILGIASPETLEMVTKLDGDTVLQAIAETIRTYIGTLALGKPTIIVIDDLHWADEASLELLHNVSNLVEVIPVLLIGLLRPDRDAASWPAIERIREEVRHHYFEINLEPLTPPDAEALLSKLITVQELPDHVRELLLRKAEGNPFFLEEVIRSLIDAGYLVRENGEWRTTGEMTQVAIPDSLAGVLAARIDRLPEDTKRVAQMAAVIGRIFAYPVLQTICAGASLEERIEPLDPHLDLLLHAQLLRTHPPPPERAYIFKHALTQEAAYNSLLLSQRKTFHGRVAAVMETLYVERLDEFALVLAHHFWNGEEWERAADYSMRAGARAMQVYALRQALDQYRRAWEALERITVPQLTRVVDAILEWAGVAYKLRRYPETLEPLQRAERIARQLNDRRRLALTLHWIGSMYLAMGKASMALPALTENGQLAEELGDDRLSTVPRFFAAMEMAEQDPRTAVQQLEHVIRLARDLHDREIEGHALGIKAMAHARLGEFEQARQEMERAIEVVTRSRSVVKQIDLNLTSGQAYYAMGDLDRGLEYSHRAAEVARDEHVFECAVAGFSCVGIGYLRAQNWDKARSAFEEGLKLSQHSGLESLNNQVRAGLAVARFFSNQSDAVDEIEVTLANAKAIGDLYFAAFLSQKLSEAYGQLGQFDNAEAHLQYTMDYYRRNEMRPYLARALHSLGDLLAEQGRLEEAQATYDEAASLGEVLGKTAAQSWRSQ